MLCKFSVKAPIFPPAPKVPMLDGRQSLVKYHSGTLGAFLYTPTHVREEKRSRIYESLFNIPYSLYILKSLIYITILNGNLIIKMGTWEDRGKREKKEGGLLCLSSF